MTGDRKLVSKLKIVSFSFLLTILSHASAFAKELQTWDNPLLPTLRVTLDDHDSIFTTIIDTGAHASVINESVVDELGIETSKESMELFFPGAAKTVKLYRTKPFKITLPTSSETFNISPIIYPTNLSIDPDFSSVSEILTRHELLLGMEDLWQLDMEIDYRKKITRLRKPREYVKKTKNNLISIDFKTTVLNTELNCTIDTGAPGILGIFIHAGHPEYDNLKSQFKNFLIMPQSHSSSKKSFGTHDPDGKIDGIRGQGLLVEFEKTDLTKETGDRCVIGGGILSKLQLQKYGERGVHYNGHLPKVSYNRTGFGRITYDKEFNNFQLKEIFKHGALYRAGVKEGDILVSFNGIPAMLDNIHLLANLATQPAGSKLKIVVKSNLKNDSGLIQEKEHVLVLTDVLANQE